MKPYFPYLFILIFAFSYLIPRLSNLSRNIEFRYDQGLHLSEVKEMVDSRHLRLLGPAVTSKTLSGRQFFIGATYYYFLAAFGVIFSWSPLYITAAITVFEFLFYAIFINHLRRRFGYLPSIVIALIISSTPYLIFHSYFFWNPHFLIPLSIPFIIYRRNPYISAFIWGIAFSFHYSAVFWLLPFLFFRYKYRQIKFKTLLMSLALFLVANSPFIFSELRHQFYNLKTMFFVFAHSSESFGITTHYFVFPLIIFIIYFSIYLSKKTNFPVYLLLFLFFLLKDQAQENMAPGWNYPAQLKISQEISESCQSSYNIAATIQGDTRAYDIRYLLNLKNCPPGAVDGYPNAKTLYLVAPPTRPPGTETVWEVDSFKPFKVTKEEKINEDVVFYRLDKS